MKGKKYILSDEEILDLSDITPFAGGDPPAFLEDGEPVCGFWGMAEEVSKATLAETARLKTEQARARLEMLMAANYSGRDLFVTLTYRDEDLPRNRAVERLRKFIKLFRTQRKKQGIELRYLYPAEEKHGDARLHHHLVINAAGADTEMLRSLWPYGDIVDVEYIGARDYEVLSMYMTKESAADRPVGAQMWTASRNMAEPVEKPTYVSNDTMLSVPLGCHVLEKEERTTEFGSYCYFAPRKLSGRTGGEHLFRRRENGGGGIYPAAKNAGTTRPHKGVRLPAWLKPVDAAWPALVAFWRA